MKSAAPAWQKTNEHEGRGGEQGRDCSPAPLQARRHDGYFLPSATALSLRQALLEVGPIILSMPPVNRQIAFDMKSFSPLIVRGTTFVPFPAGANSNTVSAVDADGLTNARLIPIRFGGWLSTASCSPPRPRCSRHLEDGACAGGTALVGHLRRRIEVEPR